MKAYEAQGGSSQALFEEETSMYSADAWQQLGNINEVVNPLLL
jgi:hypothetical protein